ncbi:unnamed protein product [Enterobius vermicularis]|uniref:WW domain-containing protein n=1 Tax=Enterobius vermicularis TaxID=51028 RepID=A0A0N4V0P7_ENTVE|nr:unnamed protein product [Enterobius vermicularis]
MTVEQYPHYQDDTSWEHPTVIRMLRGQLRCFAQKHAAVPNSFSPLGTSDLEPAYGHQSPDNDLLKC